MIADEMRGYAAATVDTRWAAQVAALGALPPGGRREWWGSDGGYLDAWRLANVAGLRGAVATAIETLPALAHLPVLERLLPLPGTARPTARGPADSAGPADERLLGKIRALLAKAESTEYAEEAEALSARAQELMAKYSIDHALLAARAGHTEHRPGGGWPWTTPTRRRRRRCCRPWRRPTAAASSGPGNLAWSR